ncbi:hypothetical protein F383_32240 [Gossypium arboreum]|uniref:Uncharacterized protein n=1 Tax=Gossypium arboreum TaxID=29729 RepID=A0A0B0N4P1_GOSAR|nr:hypothetical protein F383_32240 [Gossypium arboreum]
MNHLPFHFANSIITSQTHQRQSCFPPVDLGYASVYGSIPL